jgi:hypothetical protein
MLVARLLKYSMNAWYTEVIVMIRGIIHYSRWRRNAASNSIGIIYMKYFHQTQQSSNVIQLQHYNNTSEYSRYAYIKVTYAEEKNLRISYLVPVGVWTSIQCHSISSTTLMFEIFNYRIKPFRRKSATYVRVHIQLGLRWTEQRWCCGCQFWLKIAASAPIYLFLLGCRAGGQFARTKSFVNNLFQMWHIRDTIRYNLFMMGVSIRIVLATYSGAAAYVFE